MINVNTKLVGLLGKPLTFSFSPKMHNTTFKSMDLNYYYFSIEVDNENLEDVIKGIRHMNYAGFNVTKPNKVKVLKYLDEIDDLASKIGAVNTVKIVDGKLIGYNTDGEGYVESLRHELGFEPDGKIVTILGAGGAGRAIAFTLANYGAKKIYILNRTIENSQKVAEEVNANINNCAEYIHLSDDNLKACIDKSDIIINATGVGMSPHIDRTPFSKELLYPDIIVSDITYNPLKTKLLEEAEEVGCRIHNGVGMLIYQGAKAFELWTGIDAPVKEMTKTVHEIIENLNKK